MAVAVFKSKIFDVKNSGASMTEVLLAMAIIALATPFVYNQISQTNQTLKDIAIANAIIATRDSVLNFVRTNQDKWPESVQIKLDNTDLANISPDAVAGFIDKYPVIGTSITDVYLAFNIDNSYLHANKIAKHIGGDAAVVTDDGIAYGNTWAVAAPDFKSGDLIYRITRNISGEDTSKYLHRATSGEDDFNVMQRDLNMNKHHIHNISTVMAESARFTNTTATFINSDVVSAENVYFSGGANMDAQNVSFGNLRVSGDMYGFRNMYADNLNGSGFTTTGRIITDKATILNSIKVGNNLILKSDSTRSISGFTSITASSVFAPFIASEEMMFYNNFGITISGELLM
ncbi:MAG: hypothetical protein UIC65_01620, partial [Alphaproteobacteria bacterium]|nr:hypothetical protein [Alphaproteobacteria bacterium]